MKPFQEFHYIMTEPFVCICLVNHTYISLSCFAIKLIICRKFNDSSVWPLIERPCLPHKSTALKIPCWAFKFDVSVVRWAEINWSKTFVLLLPNSVYFMFMHFLWCWLFWCFDKAALPHHHALNPDIQVLDCPCKANLAASKVLLFSMAHEPTSQVSSIFKCIVFYRREAFFPIWLEVATCLGGVQTAWALTLFVFRRPYNFKIWQRLCAECYILVGNIRLCFCY